MSVHKKCQPNRSSRLAGYRKHIYIYTNVLFYYIDVSWDTLLLFKHNINNVKF